MVREWSEGDIGDEKAVASEGRHRYSFIDRSTEHTGGWRTIGSALIHGHPPGMATLRHAGSQSPGPDSDERISSEAPWAHQRGEAANSERPRKKCP